MASKIKAESVPYIVTIIFAVLGWTLSYIVDRVVHSPTVVVVTSIDTKDSPHNFSVMLHNISNKAFRNFSLMVYAQTPTNLTGQPSFTEPFEGAALGNATPTIENNSVTYPIKQLQPDWQFSLRVSYTGTEPPRFELKDGPADTAIRLVPPSLFTWFAKHDMVIMLILAGAMLGLGGAGVAFL